MRSLRPFFHNAAILLLSIFTIIQAMGLPPETVPPFEPGEVPAFPGAEGAGKWTVGGRGGKVFEVTSLEDSGPGTLREACEAEGPRMVVFRTGGVIHLKEKLTITNPYITIAGQTAPGGGICIGDRSFWINTHNVIVRYIRVRLGYGRRDSPGVITDDAFGGRPVSDLIVDHVSASWGHDENLSFYKMEDVNNDGRVPATERVTVQWSIIGEAMGHRFHPYGTVFGGKHADYHHNLFACNVSWEPYKVIENPTRPISLNPVPDDLNLINNVFFVWLNRGFEGGGSGTVNIINNWFVPDMDPYVADRDFRMINTIGNETGGKRCRYMAGNIMQGRENITADNWVNVQGNVQQSRSNEPFEMFEPITMDDAENAYEAVLAEAGATLPKRDTVDKRIVDATRNQKSYYLSIDTQQIDFYPFKVDGIVDFPEYKAGTALTDSDRDGMPDDWETAEELDPNDPDDGPRLKEGYSNLERYCNSLVDEGTTGIVSQPGDHCNSDLRSILTRLTVSSSTIRFQLKHGCRLTLEIFNLTGRRYPVLFNRVMTVGWHEVQLEPHRFPEGLRFVRITAGTDKKTIVLYSFN